MKIHGGKTQAELEADLVKVEKEAKEIERILGKRGDSEASLAERIRAQLNAATEQEREECLRVAMQMYYSSDREKEFAKKIRREVNQLSPDERDHYSRGENVKKSKKLMNIKTQPSVTTLLEKHTSKIWDDEGDGPPSRNWVKNQLHDAYIELLEEVQRNYGGEGHKYAITNAITNAITELKSKREFIEKINELIETYALGDSLRQFSIQLLELIDADAQKNKDENGMPDYAETIDLVVEQLKNELEK